MRRLRLSAALNQGEVWCLASMVTKPADTPRQTETPRRSLTGAIIPVLAVAALVATVALVAVSQRGPAGKGAPVAENCILENADAVGGPIDLIDSNGARVTQADFAGSPAVVYFGFTHCPDVCPTSMYVLAEALSQPTGFDIQPVLISVDPARDTPSAMAEYLQTQGFPAGLIGLTRPGSQVAAAEAAFRVYAQRAPGNVGDTNYNIDHSSLLYVLDGSWRTVAIIPTMSRADPEDPRSPMVATSAEDISACIAAGLSRS